MTHSTKLTRPGLVGLLIVSVVLLAGSVAAHAQEEQTGAKNAAKRSSQAGRDPFRKYEPPRVVVRKGNLVLPPPITERINQYRAQKQAAMSARIPAPKPTTALLLSEIQVVGISRSPRGYAAIVEATPIKMSFVIYPGERFYDGQLVAIEDGRLVFRRETVFTDGRRERSVELKPLRQPSTVDAFSAARTPTPAAPVQPETTADNKPAQTQKP